MFTNLILENPEDSAAEFLSFVPLSDGDAKTGIQWFKNYLNAILGGQRSGSFIFQVGAVKATATITFSSTGPTNNQTCTILGTTFTAKTSGATGNEFNISATPSIVATNLATAINNSATTKVTGSVIASVVSGVVTLTSLTPGAVGNGFVIANVDLSNAVFSSFSSNGSNGTVVALDLS